MREIDVDLDVYAAIWAARIPSEASENDVLRRLLLQKEVNSSKPPQTLTPISTSGEPKMSITFKIRWIDDVISAFHHHGGEADLSAIYKTVSQLRLARDEKEIKTIEATVRRTIEEHSSDSENFGRNSSAPNYFAKVGRGRWRLR